VTGEDDGRGRLGRWAVHWGMPGQEVGQNQGNWAALLTTACAGRERAEEMSCTWGRQSGLQERKRGNGPEGENWPKRFREKTLSYFQNIL
jgi:hypothetical protein